MVGKKVCQGCPDRFEGCVQLEVVRPVIRKETLREVAEYLEKEYSGLTSRERVFIAHLKAGMLP